MLQDAANRTVPSGSGDAAADLLEDQPLGQITPNRGSARAGAAVATRAPKVPATRATDVKAGSAFAAAEQAGQEVPRLTAGLANPRPFHAPNSDRSGDIRRRVSC